MRFKLTIAALVLALGIALPVLATTQTGPLTVSVTTSPNPFALEGTTSVKKSVGVLAYGTGSTDVALEGYTTLAGSTGLEGFAQAKSGTIGDGVFGYSGNGVGVYGSTASAYPALYGDNTGTGAGLAALSSGSNGVMGATSAVAGASSYAGVSGTDESTSKGNFGVFGTSAYGSGVYGTTTGTGTTDYGVYGNETSSTENADGDFAGVYGNSANNFGVIGETSNGDTDTTFAGVEGVDTTGGNIGVSGVSDYGFGVEGQTQGGEGIEGVATGQYGNGVFGNTTGASGAGVVAESSSDTGYALLIHANNGTAILAQDGSTPIMSLDTSGNMILKGGLTMNGTPTATVRDAAGTQRVAYAPRETQATIEDAGRAQTTSGRAYVALDPAFASVLASPDYLVFVTPRGPNSGFYVMGQTLAGFEVRMSQGTANVAFDYRIVGRPRSNSAEPRLAVFAGDPHGTAIAARDAAVRSHAASHRHGSPSAHAPARLRTRIETRVPAIPAPFGLDPNQR